MIELLRNDAAGKLVLRLTVGILMLFHGVSKLMHSGSVDFIGSKLTEAGLPALLANGVYVGEVVAPVMILLGVFSRVGGLIVVINMLFAVLLVHTGDILALTDHGGWRLELQAFYLFGALAIVFLGSGKYAVRPD
jgi:putative oxidoreductase